MNTWTIGTMLVVAGGLSTLIAVDCWLCWMAAGEADVNGAPERDSAGEIKQVCAYCPDQRFIGGNPHGEILSHGICGDCARAVLDEHFNHRNEELAESSNSSQASSGRTTSCYRNSASLVPVGTFSEADSGRASNL